MSKSLLHIFLFLLASCPLLGQERGSVSVNFGFYFDGQPLELGKSYVTSLNGEVSVETLRLYVSQLSFWSKGKEVYTDAHSYYLLDASKPESLLRRVNIPKGLAFDAVHFNFGIDEATNNKGVGEGDLDPANDMYWAWQSGYINLKLEGVYGAKHESFQYHLGGFLKPNVSCRSVEVAITNTAAVVIAVDVAPFFQAVNISAKSRVMSPGAASVQLSDVAAKMFRIP
ncbi:MbnP family protein [Flavobacterium sp. RHBU_3]|uniref:MbnP family protein n=1 Tax=Flavobacterium sp. RHBU_3 TaxID=3391184 RepID=UPI003984A009